jgi:hypothetical protein
VNLLRGGIPVQAWWLRESIEPESIWKSITMYYWLDNNVCRLPNPVMVDLVNHDVYDLEVKKNYGMLEFANLPISTTPVLITDRSILDVES